MSTTANIDINLQGDAISKLNELNKKFGSFGKSVENVGGQMVKAMRIDAIKNIADSFSQLNQGMMSMADVGASFEQQMADLSAITGISGKNLEELGRTARSVGVSSGLGATEATEAFKLLASQISVDKIGIDGLKQLQKETIKLSQAGGLDLPSAANAMAGAMNQFGLEASEASRVVNILAAGSKYGAAEIPELAQSFKIAGVSASAAGVSMETTVGAIETLSKSGLKGAEAGTALRNVLTKMQTTLGMDVSGDGFVKGLKSLTPMMSDASFMAKTFGAENMNAATFLIKNTKLLKDMTKSVTGTDVATEQASIRTSTYAERVKRLNAWTDDFKISIFNLTNSFLPYSDAILTATANLMQYAPAISSSFELVGKLTKATTYQTIWTNAVAVATGVWTGVQWLLNIALNANPIGLVVGGIVLLVSAITLAYRNCETFRNIVNIVWQVLKGMFGIVMILSVEIWNFIKSISQGIVAFFEWSGIVSVAKNTFLILWEALKKVFQIITFIPMKIYDFIKMLGGAILKSKTFKNAIFSVVNVLVSFWEKIKEIWQKGKDFFEMIFGGSSKTIKLETSAKTENINKNKLEADIPSTNDVSSKESLTTNNETIITGGKKQTVLNISIGTVGDFKDIVFNNVEEGVEDIENKIKETLFNALGGLTTIAK